MTKNWENDLEEKLVDYTNGSPASLSKNQDESPEGPIIWPPGKRSLKNLKEESKENS